MTDKMQPWDVFLLARNQRERYELLPAELRGAIEGMIGAAIDLYDETFSDPFSTVDAAPEKVQAQPTSPGGRRVNKGRNKQARYLRSTLPGRLEGMRTEMKQWIAGVERPRTGPRFRDPKSA